MAVASRDAIVGCDAWGIPHWLGKGQTQVRQLGERSEFSQAQAAGTGSISKVRAYQQAPQSRQIRHGIHHFFLHKAVCTRQAP